MAQKRSENTYQKINTLYKRDDKGLIILGDYSDPNYEYLKNNLWDIEEKIDGTNIRIEVTLEVINMTPLQFKYGVKYKGKTDNANIPPKLLEHLQNTYPREKVLNALELPLSDFMKKEDDGYPNKVTIYGEGYGTKIQACGSKYLSKDNSFILFDIKIDNWWLLKESRDKIAQALEAPIVPYLGQMTLSEAESLVQKGFTSLISEDKDLIAEGVVARIPTGLKNRRGERTIVKIKTRDYNKLKS
jgi:hypothetical protein